MAPTSLECARICATVSKPIGVVIADAMSGNVDGAHLAIHHLVGRGDALIDGRRERHDLEHRSRLVERADGAVHARFRGLLSAGALGLNVGQLAMARISPFDGILHDHRAGLGVRLADGRGQLLFGDELDIFVDGQHDARAGVGRLVRAVVPAAVRVGEDQHARRPCCGCGRRAAYSIPPMPFSSIST